MAESNASSGGVGFLGVLQVAFIVLRLMGVITWKWVWVLAPTWGPVILILVILAILYALVH